MPNECAVAIPPKDTIGCARISGLFIALIALVNGLFGWIHGALPWFPESLQAVLGWIFRPMGVLRVSTWWATNRTTGKANRAAAGP